MWRGPCRYPHDCRVLQGGFLRDQAPLWCCLPGLHGRGWGEVFAGLGGWWGAVGCVGVPVDPRTLHRDAQGGWGSLSLSLGCSDLCPPSPCCRRALCPRRPCTTVTSTTSPTWTCGSSPSCPRNPHPRCPPLSLPHPALLRLPGSLTPRRPTRQPQPPHRPCRRPPRQPPRRKGPRPPTRRPASSRVHGRRRTGTKHGPG